MAWNRMRAREREFEAAAHRRTKELTDLDRLLSDRTTLLNERAVAFDKQWKEAQPRLSPSRVERGWASTRDVHDAPNRQRTGVRGLDEALGGGIPRGHLVIVEGAPGTLKTSLGLWILAHCAKEGGRGLYVTFEESAKSLLVQAKALDLPLDVEEGQLRFLDARSLSPRNDRTAWLAGLKRALKAADAEVGLDLIVLDSLDGLEVLAKFRDRRLELFRLFRFLREIEATILLIAERADYVVHGAVLQSHHDENFLADGVLHLRSHPVSDTEIQRRIRIVKMRGTRHEMGYLAMHVMPGELEVARAMGG